MKKENRNSSTILLSMLAFTDAMTAILITVKNITPHLDIFGGDDAIFQELNYFSLFRYEWSVNYPGCVVYNFVFYLSLAFHLMSVLLTMGLCVQKTTAMIFPIWVNTNVSRRLWLHWGIASCLVPFIVYFLIFWFLQIRLQSRNGTCCWMANGQPTSHYIVSFIESIMYVLSLFIIMICTLIISCKLTCLRRSQQRTDSVAT